MNLQPSNYETEQGGVLALVKSSGEPTLRIRREVVGQVCPPFQVLANYRKDRIIVWALGSRRPLRRWGCACAPSSNRCYPPAPSCR